MGCMTTFNFPPLRIGLLQGLMQLKERVDSDGFEMLESAPYDNETRGVLTRLFAPKVIEKRVEVPQEKERVGRGRPSNDVALSAEDQNRLKEEIDSLMDELNNLGKGASEDDTVTLDTGERIKIIQTKSRLLDQLLKMQERVFNIKRMSNFQEVVIGILDDVVDEDGREVFLKRIEPWRDQ